MQLFLSENKNTGSSSNNNTVFEADSDVQLLVDYLGTDSSSIQITRDPAAFPAELKDHPLKTPALKVDNNMIVGSRAVLIYLAHTKKPELMSAGAVAQIDQWISFCATAIKPALSTANTKATRTFARALNEFLLTRTYFVGQRFSLADLAVYANVYPYLAGLTKKQRFEVPNLSRWFDLMQHTPGVKLNRPLIEFDLDENVKSTAAPAAGASGTKPKKEAKPAKEGGAVKEGAVPAPTAAAAVGAPAAGSAGSTNKKEKKEKAPAQPKTEGENKGGNKNAPKELPLDISRVDLRVGRIVEVNKHPDGTFLYLEKIDIGEPEPRQVVSGLVKWYTLEEMQNRDIIVVCNMKPAVMRGIQSFAMVLCAKDENETIVEFVNPPPGSKPGDRVFCKGFDGKPDDVLNPKKKVFEQLKPDLRTNDDPQNGW